MKLSLTSFLVASSLSLSSAFVVQPIGPVGRTSVISHASRAANKKASRSKWLETRGFSAGGAATVEAPTSSGIMKNDEGLEYVKLVHPDTGASAEVYLYGGVVTSYKDADGTEFIAVRPDAKMDGSKPISGGLSHCWPQVSQRRNPDGIACDLLIMYVSCFSLAQVQSNSMVLRAMSCGLSNPPLTLLLSWRWLRRIIRKKCGIRNSCAHSLSRWRRIN